MVGNCVDKILTNSWTVAEVGMLKHPGQLFASLDLKSGWKFRRKITSKLTFEYVSAVCKAAYGPLECKLLECRISYCLVDKAILFCSGTNKRVAFEDARHHVTKKTAIF
jgi:hypothetical protein